jgi:hypothetical protein
MYCCDSKGSVARAGPPWDIALSWNPSNCFEETQDSAEHTLFKQPAVFTDTKGYIFETVNAEVWEEGIKMDLREIVSGMWSGFTWLRIGIAGGLL